MRHAGAKRGLLVLTQGVDQLIEAEAEAEKSPGSEGVTFRLRQAKVTADDLPESLFQHVVSKILALGLRQRESVNTNSRVA